MTEDNTQDTNEESTTDELTVLKQRANQMGIKFHPKIGLEKLRLKVNKTIESAGIDAEPEAVQLAPAIPTNAPSNLGVPIKKTKAQLDAESRKNASKLIRIRVNCMNPNKKDYEGEIFTVSNSVVGTFKKYVPYNTENGWHVPNIIYQHLKERQCQIFITVKGPRNEKQRKGKLIKEFAVEVLDPLTSDEIQELATRQAMANNIN